jgi:hypothetical protein
MVGECREFCREHWEHCKRVEFPDKPLLVLRPKVDCAIGAQPRPLTSRSAQLRLDKSTPDLIRFPNRMQVPFSVSHSHILVQYPIQKYERRDALVDSTMNEHWPVIKGPHRLGKRAEILGSWSLEIHRKVHVSHPKACDDAPFVRESVIRRRQGQVDDCLEACILN